MKAAYRLVEVVVVIVLTGLGMATLEGGGQVPGAGQASADGQVPGGSIEPGALTPEASRLTPAPVPWTELAVGQRVEISRGDGHFRGGFFDLDDLEGDGGGGEGAMRGGTFARVLYVARVEAGPGPGAGLYLLESVQLDDSGAIAGGWGLLTIPAASAELFTCDVVASAP